MGEYLFSILLLRHHWGAETEVCSNIKCVHFSGGNHRSAAHNPGYTVLFIPSILSLSWEKITPLLECDQDYMEYSTLDLGQEARCRELEVINESTPLSESWGNVNESTPLSEGC